MVRVMRDRGCGRGTLAVWSRFGSVVVLSRYGCGAVEVRSWCNRGTPVVQSRYARGAVEVRSWCGRGTLMVRSRYAHGAVEVRFPYAHRCSSGSVWYLTFYWADCTGIPCFHINKMAFLLKPLYFADSH